MHLFVYVWMSVYAFVGAGENARGRDRESYFAVRTPKRVFVYYYAISGGSNYPENWILFFTFKFQ